MDKQVIKTLKNIEKKLDSMEENSVTKNDIKQVEKRLNRKSSKDKKELMHAIANVAINSPTLEMHSKLDERVQRLEYH